MLFIVSQPVSYIPGFVFTHPPLSASDFALFTIVMSVLLGPSGVEQLTLVQPIIIFQCICFMLFLHLMLLSLILDLHLMLYYFINFNVSENKAQLSISNMCLSLS